MINCTMCLNRYAKLILEDWIELGIKSNAYLSTKKSKLIDVPIICLRGVLLST